MLNGKVMIIHLIVGLKNSKNKIKFKLDLSNYVTKSNLKIATGVDTTS